MWRMIQRHRIKAMKKFVRALLPLFLFLATACSPKQDLSPLSENISIKVQGSAAKVLFAKGHPGSFRALIKYNRPSANTLGIEILKRGKSVGLWRVQNIDFIPKHIRIIPLVFSVDKAENLHISIVEHSDLSKANLFHRPSGPKSPIAIY